MKSGIRSFKTIKNVILDEFKFEEDIMREFVSKFSASADLETNEESKFDIYQDILSLYPNLNDLGISSSEKLIKVNEFEANEVSYELGKIEFGDDNNKAKVQVSLWYLSTNSPIIVEFDIDLEAEESTHDVSNQLEGFSTSLIIGIHKLYLNLRIEGIIDNSSPKTKTDFAYEYGRT